MQLISLFSGIGGFELAAEWMRWNVISTCEIEPFARRVLKYYWPDAYHHEDIKTLTKNTLLTNSKWKSNEKTILTGGFPCQPFSLAGSRRGTEDDRYLWPEMFRIIKEVRPDWIVPENVAGITTMALPSSPIKVGSQTNLYGEGDSLYELRERFVLNQIIDDFESIGYTVAPLIIPAEAVGAPHRRERIWIVANANNEGLERDRFERENSRRKDTKGQFRQDFRAWDDFPTQPPICSGNDGVSSKLDGITFPKWRQESIKAYGNAIVPQVAFELFKAIEMAENY